MNKFLQGIERVENMVSTENGAKVHSVNVLNPLVKCLYNISDNRADIVSCKYEANESLDKRNSVFETNIVKDIIDISKDMDLENKETLARFIAYIRDPRRGLGERSLFRSILIKLIENGIFTPKTDNYDFCKAVVEYGRWDDLIAILFGVHFTNKVKFEYTKNFVENIENFIKEQLYKDINVVNNGDTNISLLAKWMPSINSHSRYSKEMAKMFIKKFGITNEEYRKVLSKLRKVINIVESNICQNTYKDIDYSKVPSLAMTKYNEVFRNHDGDRFKEYLESLKKGETKINTSVSNPVELVSRMTNYRLDSDTFNEMWKSLPEVNVEHNIIPVCDLSGSMYVYCTDSIQSYHVSTAMSMYLSEHNKGVFKDKVITFSREPKIIDLSDCKNARDKFYKIFNAPKGLNTNIYRTMKLVLDIAVENNCTQDEIPDLVIITDGEFDSGLILDDIHTLFDNIGKEYNKYGYELPRLIFWNTMNRSKSVPITENKNGLLLISGYSTNIINMICSNKLDPLEVLLETLSVEWLDNSKVFVQ